jgi:hypothetical protein
MSRASFTKLNTEISQDLRGFETQISHAQESVALEQRLRQMHVDLKFDSLCDFFESVVFYHVNYSSARLVCMSEFCMQNFILV